MKGNVSPERLNRIIRAVSDAHGIPRREIVGADKKQVFCRARLEIIRLLHADGYCNAVIGRALNRDRSTIYHWLRKDAA